MKLILVAIFLSFTFYYRSFGQDAPPATDIWLLKLQKTESNAYEVSNYKKITDNPGYDNQPYFLPALNSLVYVSDKNQNQTDIYQFYFATGTSKKVLSTEYYKEYSPMLSYDGDNISCISIEPDNSSQRFWEFPFSGGIGKPLFPDVTDVGYYCWLDEDQVAFFRLGKTTNTIHIANTSSGDMQKLDDDAGRCIQKARNHNWMYYVKKYDSLNWKIKCYDIGKSLVIGEIPLPQGQEDFTVGPNDVIWLSADGKVLEASVQNPKWKIVFDFSNMPFKNFYRITFSPEYNMLALVTYEGKKP